MTITTNPRSTRWRIAALAAACLLALPVSACGAFGGSGGDGLSAAEQAKSKDAWLKVAQCMREQGVPVNVGEDGGYGLEPDANVDSDTIEKAEKACKDLLEAALATEPEGAGEPLSAEDKQRLLAEAQCMRERGWDQPDPEFPGGNKINWELPPNVDVNDSKYQKDGDECKEKAGDGEEE